MTVPSATNAGARDAARGAFDSRDLSVRVYQVLQQDILDGLLPPGARLSLDDLAERFGVSVSPIRDALRLLAADGLVELRSRRGAFVTAPSRAVILEACQFRAILERAAIDAAIAVGAPLLAQLRAHVEAMPATVVGDTHTDYMAYLRHDQAFHQLLIDAVGNRMFSASYVGLSSFTLIARMLHVASSHRATETLAEHRAILDAIAAGDAGAARAAIDLHLQHACDDLLRLVDAVAPANEGEPNDRARERSRAKHAAIAATGAS